MQGLEKKIKDRVSELLESSKVDAVIGWEKGQFIYDPTPAVFTKETGLDNFCYNNFCGANLSKYLVGKITSDKKYAVLLKPCDTYSMNQLITEHRVNRDNIYIIGIGCDGHLNVEKIKSKGISGITGVSVDGESVTVSTIYGESKLDKSEVLLGKCEVCKGNTHKISDELIGEELEVPVAGDRFEMVAKLEAMTAEERFKFWQGELSRCIRCNACRNVCPACTCRVCVFDNGRSGIDSKANASEFEEQMFHIIRAFHVSARCTDCGECSRVCPENIPLHLLNRKYVKDINEFYGEYQAGEESEQRNPLVNFGDKDIDPTVISDKGGK